MREAKKVVEVPGSCFMRATNSRRGFTINNIPKTLAKIPTREVRVLSSINGATGTGTGISTSARLPEIRSQQQLLDLRTAGWPFRCSARWSKRLSLRFSTMAWTTIFYVLAALTLAAVLCIRSKTVRHISDFLALTL